VRVTFLGTGTSQGVPVIACDCAVCTSSDGHDKRLRPSVLLEHEGVNVVMDDIRAFNYRQQSPVDVYADLRVQDALKREFSYVFAEFKYPGIPQLNLHTIGLQPFDIGPLHFTPIEVMHYKLPVLGFRVSDFTYITDAKTISPVEREKIKGSKVLVINALQFDSHISHFTFDEAIEFANEMAADITYFTHISHRLGRHADISQQLPPHIKLAYDGLKLNL